MYRNSQVDQKEELRVALGGSAYSTQVEEKSFDDLLLKDSKVDTTMSMPSQTTLEYENFEGEIDYQEQENLVVKEKYSISTRGKALIAVYAFILISIFAFIIFNATYLRGLDRKIQKAETSVFVAEQMLKVSTEELAEAKNEATIIEKAIQMGMIK